MLSHLFSFSSQAYANEETYFVATAYYSPLPGQSRYTTGSYAWDIRLNGEGHTTASGKEVFPGLLAGPKNYPFGTKIYFEWFGIGSIEDRGWAIVKAGQRGHSYDRIDIWMWYGDEGLERALAWGTRTIKWKIVVPSSEVSLSFPESPLWVLTGIEVNPESANSEDVKKLQIIFQKAELYSWEIDGTYESIKNELIEFQIKSWIIDSSDHPHAGWYGNKTIAALREKYGSWNDSILLEEPIENFANYNHKIASEKYKIILEYGDLVVKPDSDEETIKAFQNMMQELWEYSWKIDGKYSSIEDELISLQKKIWLISNRDDWGAWYFWNSTKSALWKYYEKENDNFISQQAGSNSLDLKEKERMKLAFEIVVDKLKKDEKRWKPSAESRLKNLEKQIDTYLPQVQDNTLKLKLLYLKELI